MKSRYLFLTTTFFFLCIPAICQHSYSKGGNPFYWAIAGGLGSVIIFIIYLLFSFLNKQIKKRHKGTNEENNNTNEVGRSNLAINTKKLPRIKLEKHKTYATILFILSLLIAIIAIEVYIYNRKENLYKQLNRRVESTFENTVDGHDVQALNASFINKVKYQEVAIPPSPKFDSWDNSKKEYWDNMFSGIEHLYKLTVRGWTMQGMVYGIFPDVEGHPHIGIINYFYYPYMVCVPHGAYFNDQIAKDVLQEALNKVYREPHNFETIDEVKTFSNDYYHLVGQSSNPEYFPFVFDKKTGSYPITENGKPTGLYRFGMVEIGNYRVLLAYENSITWNIVEKDGFRASLKDRVILYSISLLLLTSIYIIIRRKINKKIGLRKLIVIESLEKRLIRLSNPLNFVNSTNPLDVSNASSINERLLEKPLGDEEEILLANELKDKLGINLISTKEKEYLIEIGAGFLKKNKKKLNIDITKLVNHLYVLISDINQIDGKTYCEIQKTIEELSRS